MKNVGLILRILIFSLIVCSPALGFGLEVGDKAPPFVAQSTHGEISLADFEGEKNVVLALYFAVFTPV